jgi:hypothetical protein
LLFVAGGPPPAPTAAEGRATQQDGLVIGAGQRHAGLDDRREDRAVILLHARIAVPVRDGRLHGTLRHPVGDGVRDVGEADVDDLRAQRDKRRERVGEHRLRTGVHVVAVPRHVDADAEGCETGADRRVVRDRGQRRGRVIRIRPRDGAQQEARIEGAAGHRPDMVQRRRQFGRAVAAHASPRRLQPRQAIGRGRPADRAARVRGQRTIGHARRDGDAGTARRDAGPVVRAPWIARRDDGRMVVGIRAFGELGFADEDRAGGLQAPHHRRVAGRHGLAAQPHAGAGGHAFDVEQVLDRDRHAVQRTAPCVCRDLFVGRVGLCERGVGHHQRVRMQVAVERRDPVEQCLGHLAGRHGAVADQGRKLADIEVVQGRGWFSHSLS